jgi:serine protease Do
VFGLAVADLTDAQKKELNLKGGVRVEAATDAAARAGLREGDLILQVGNVEVATVKEFEAVIAKFDKSKALSVLFRRGEWTQYAILKVAK